MVIIHLLRVGENPIGKRKTDTYERGFNVTLERMTNVVLKKKLNFLTFSCK